MNLRLKVVALFFVTVLAGCYYALFFYHDGSEGHSYADPKDLVWPFDGMTGHFDRQSAQRGFQVYREVCASCHSLNRIAFRNLADIGFSEAEVKALAAEYMVMDAEPNDEGEMFERPGRPADRIPKTYPNEQAARYVNNGAYPPDLSLIVKARVDGPDYLYSLLTGYGQKVPSNVAVSEGTYYNPYFSLSQGIAMAPPLMNDLVSYEDGTNASVEQMARDVVVFLQWTAEPEMEERKRMGIKVLMFLLIMTVLFYFAKKRVWRNAK